MKTPPVVELTLPVLPDMELAATKTAEVVTKHMGLDEEKSAEISMALIEACINAFEHSQSDKQIEIHFKIKEDLLEIQVTDKGKGFDKSKVKIPKIEVHISNIYNREEFRKNSFISSSVNGIIAGFGTDVYKISIQSINYLLVNHENR